ncbi:MAG: hypothetical protein II567_08955 [Candidatus Riflebacteria bacterium]|jgi:hypothetical protein|nr:hypothetical protein [Candidatus Riflebacteria bacterium]
MKKLYYILVLCGIIFLAGCGETNSPKAKKSNSSAAELDKSLSDIRVKSGEKVDYDKLRKKANVAEAASMAGYDGKALKKDLNKIIDEREKMDKQLNDLDL